MKKQKSLSTLLVLITALIVVYCEVQAQSKLPKITIGIAIDGSTDIEDVFFNLIKNEISHILRDQYDVQFPEEKIVSAQWSLERAKKGANWLLNDQEVDLVIALGVLTSNVFCCRRNLTKPVFALVVIDREIQKFPYQNGVSGVHNLNYLLPTFNIKKQLEKYRKLVDFKRITFVAPIKIMESLPQLKESQRLNIEDMQINATYLGIEEHVENVIESIPEDAEAVAVWPLVLKSKDSFNKFSNDLIKQKIPSFSLCGIDYVEQGLMATFAAPDAKERIARRVALNVQRVLLGEDAGSLPVKISLNQQLIINMATARAINFYPPWEVTADALLLNEESRDKEPKVTLFEAIKQSLNENLDLKGHKIGIEANNEDIHLARSNLLPQLEISATGSVIDKDRANGSFGVAERTVTGKATLSQLLYSEPVWKNLSIQHILQNSRLAEHDTLALNIIHETATIYLNILRSKTLVKIMKDNLKVTRSNLEVANVRNSIGISGPSEVYRWESQLATSKKNVLDAEVQVSLAKIALNRILNKPQDTAFDTEEISLSDPRMLTSDPRIDQYTRDPWNYAIFIDFLVQEGLAAAPELRQLEAAITAQKKTLELYKHAFYSPTVGLQAEITHKLSESGQGSESFDMSGLPIPGLDNFITQPDDTEWFVGLSISLPLYKGGSRCTEYRKAKKELARLTLEKLSIKEKIEQRIRSSMTRTGVSHPNIALSKEAAEAAHKNLELISDAYSRGVISIIELIDAHNAALVADQVAANAVYDFIIDMMEILRATANFEVIFNTDTREKWFERLEDYFGQKKSE